MVRWQPESVAAGRPKCKSPLRPSYRRRALCTEVGSVSVSLERDASRCLKRVKEAFTLRAFASRATARNSRKPVYGTKNGPVLKSSQVLAPSSEAARDQG